MRILNFKSLIILLFLSIILVPTLAAETVTIDKIKYTINEQEGTATVEDGDSDIQVANIQESVTYNGVDYAVTRLGYFAFSSCSLLTDVVIPNSVISTDDYIFYECVRLSSITISDSVKTLGRDAFFGCSSLATAHIGSGLESFLGGLFGNCGSLSAITVDDDNKYFSSVDGVLFNKDKSSIVRYPTAKVGDNYIIPNTVNTVAFHAFNNSNLVSIEVPNSVDLLDTGAFYESSKLKNVILPNSIDTIGVYLFSGCSALTKIDIPSSVVEIQKGAFYQCQQLTELTGASSVKAIGSFAFAESKLSKLELPNSLRTIGNRVFKDCESLESVIMGENVETIGNSAFESCSKLTTVELNSKLKSIGEYAFSECSLLEEIELNSSLKYLGEYAFKYCSSLKQLDIPSTITSIGDGSFEDCEALESVTIGQEISEIGNSAFYMCKSLKEIDIPNSVTSIGDYAFSGCDLLERVVIGEKVEEIGDLAFSNSRSLKEVYVKNPNPVTITLPVFYPGYSATLYVPQQALDTYNNTSPWSMFRSILAAPEYEYIPLVRENVEWGYTARTAYPVKPDLPNEYYRIQIKGDIEVDGKIYKKVYRYTQEVFDESTAHLVAYVREIDKKVYAITISDFGYNYPYGDPGVEYLIYDFSLGANDNTPLGIAGDTDGDTITEITEIEIDGVMRKRIYLDSYSIIEGMGVAGDEPYGDLITPFPMLVTGWNNRVWLNYERDLETGEIIYITEEADYDDPTISGVKGVVNDKVEITITNDSQMLKVTTPNSRCKSVRVLNISGELVRNITCDGSSSQITIPTETLPTAIYIIIVETDCGMATAKVCL